MGFVHRWQTRKLLQYFNCLNGHLLMSTTCLPHLVSSVKYPQVWEKQLHPSAPATGDTSGCSTSQSGGGFCSPSCDPRIPQESVLCLVLTDWRGGKPPGTHSEHWNQGKKTWGRGTKPSRLVFLRTCLKWQRMTEMNWNCGIFAIGKGQNISGFYITSAVLGCVWNRLLFVTNDYLSSALSRWVSVYC